MVHHSIQNDSLLIAQIFKNLGLPHVLEMYVEGVKSTNTPSIDEVSQVVTLMQIVHTLNYRK